MPKLLLEKMTAIDYATLRDDKVKTIEYCFYRRNSSKTRRVASLSLGQTMAIDYACLRACRTRFDFTIKKKPSFRLGLSI